MFTLNRPIQTKLQYSHIIDKQTWEGLGPPEKVTEIQVFEAFIAKGICWWHLL